MSLTESHRSRRVYVGHLNYKTTCQNLINHMKTCGNVLNADILTDRWNRSLGCGIVEYETEEEALASIDNLNDTELDGFKIFVREDREEQQRSKRSHNSEGCKIFVGNLPYSTRWQDLKDEFQSVGKVIRADIIMDNQGYSRGSGTVLFETPEEAQNAIELYDGQLFEGRQLHVRLYHEY